MKLCRLSPLMSSIVCLPRVPCLYIVVLPPLVCLSCLSSACIFNTCFSMFSPSRLSSVSPCSVSSACLLSHVSLMSFSMLSLFCLSLIVPVQAVPFLSRLSLLTLSLSLSLSLLLVSNLSTVVLPFCLCCLSNCYISFVLDLRQ